MFMTTKTRVDDSGLDVLNPATTTARDATHFRAIVAASEAVDAAESELRAAVREAREAGDSWTVIGAALGVSKQAAQQRFAKF
jgi:dihydroxyacetone kinase